MTPRASTRSATRLQRENELRREVEILQREQQSSLEYSRHYRAQAAKHYSQAFLFVRLAIASRLRCLVWWPAKRGIAQAVLLGVWARKRVCNAFSWGKGGGL